MKKTKKNLDDDAQERGAVGGGSVVEGKGTDVRRPEAIRKV